MYKNRSKKGSALIISILLLAVISTASFAVARLALIELKSGDLAVGNVKAYYLAEGGIEEGLLRWRYNHNADIHIGTTSSTATSKIFEKTEIKTEISGSNITRQEATAANFNSGLDSASDYIGLTVYNRVVNALGKVVTSPILANFFHFGNTAATNPFIDKYIAARPDLYVNKDDKISFVVPKGGAADLNLVWRFHRLAAVNSATADLDWGHRSGAGQFGVEIRLYTVSASGTAGALLKRAVYSPSLASQQISGAKSCGGGPACSIHVKSMLNESAFTDSTLITITPINANIVVGAYGLGDNAIDPAEFTDSVTHIESVGTSGGRSRGLTTTIDRSSGQVLGLFDYVLFQGS